ncbi:MAG: SpoIIE family protein phosphatase [Blastocatellia bacterium]|nr:SpoIIE family protein phosphatase [Blastocatellia bacterium]
MLKHTIRLLAVLVIAWTCSSSAFAGGQTPVTWDAVSAPAGIELREGWRYRSGDDPAWAAATLDDSQWEPLASPALLASDPPATGWTGIGWFRIHLDVDASAADRPLAFEIFHLGASEIYVDGEKIAGWGTVAATTDTERTFQPRGRPVALQFRGAGPHVIAIRYSIALSAPGTSWTADWLSKSSMTLGYFARIRTVASSVETVVATSRGGAGFSVGAFVLMASLALMHLLLFAFNRESRGNLFYGLFAAGSALLVFVNFLRNHGNSGLWETLGFLLANRMIFPVLLVTFWTFLHATFAERIPRFVAPVGIVWIASNLTGFLFPATSQVTSVLSIMISAAVAADGIRVMVQAIRRRVSGAVIIGIGVMCFSLLTVREILKLFSSQLVVADGFVELVALLGLILSVSVALARNVGRTHHALQEQLVQVRELSEAQIAQERREAELRLEQEHERAQLAALEAENRRTAAELEEARQLQLSLLPSTLPKFEGLSIAAFMRPATEVGGDYYDFANGNDGSLTIAIGDATGHGLRAGSLVTATKSLFVAYADENDLGRMLSLTTRALKQLRLHRLYMALTVAKVDGGRLRIASAGMPPAFIYRSETKEIDEIVIRAMPLGSVVTFPYAEVDVALGPGDVVLLMSDGFPERMNAEREMPGFERAREVLAALGHLSAEEILDGFVRDGDDWAGDAPQNDDVTFVVVKVEAER